MFKRLILRLKNRLKRSPQTKARKAGTQTVSVATENKKEKFKEKTMNEEEKKVSEKVDETAPAKGEEVKKEEVKEETTEKKSETPAPEETAQSEPTVDETEPEGNGVPLDLVVLKPYLDERLAAFEAKLDAVLKENADLKSELSATKDRYETKDFGNAQRQGMQEMKNRGANDTFDEYSKQFM